MVHDHASPIINHRYRLYAFGVLDFDDDLTGTGISGVLEQLPQEHQPLTAVSKGLTLCQAQEIDRSGRHGRSPRKRSDSFRALPFSITQLATTLIAPLCIHFSGPEHVQIVDRRRTQFIS